MQPPVHGFGDVFVQDVNQLSFMRPSRPPLLRQKHAQLHADFVWGATQQICRLLHARCPLSPALYALSPGLTFVKLFSRDDQDGHRVAMPPGCIRLPNLMFVPALVLQALLPVSCSSTGCGGANRRVLDGVVIERRMAGPGGAPSVYGPGVKGCGALQLAQGRHPRHIRTDRFGLLINSIHSAIKSKRILRGNSKNNVCPRPTDAVVGSLVSQRSRFRGGSPPLSVLPLVRILMIMRRARGPTSPPSKGVQPTSRLLCPILSYR